MENMSNIETPLTQQYQQISPETAFVLIIVLCILLFIGNIPIAVANPVLQRKNHKKIKEMIKMQTENINLISSSILQPSPPTQQV